MVHLEAYPQVSRKIVGTNGDCRSDLMCGNRIDLVQSDLGLDLRQRDKVVLDLPLPGRVVKIGNPVIARPSWPSPASGGHIDTLAHLVEFGTGPRFQKSGRYTGSVAPQPMLQPAWDMHKSQILEGLGKRLWDEIEKTMARRAKRAAKG